MNRETIILQKNRPPDEKPKAEAPTQEEEARHNEAVAFIERNRNIFEHVARGEVDFQPAPAGLNTFAFNLETDQVYIQPRFYEKKELSDEKTAFATCHELEHFKEKKGMLAEPAGVRKFSRYLDKLKDDGYGILDNCVADIRENKAVLAEANPAWRELEISLYRDDLFPDLDFTSTPRHIQFSEALLREARGPAGEMCVVSPEVREKLEQVRSLTGPDGSMFMDVLTDTRLPMSERLKLQDAILWPIIKELREQDIKDKKPDQENGDDENKNQGQSKEKGIAKSKSKKTGKGGKPKPDPNEIFKDDYRAASERNPSAVPLDEIKKTFKNWQERHGQSPLDKADTEYAEKIGVTEEDLRRYRQVVVSLEQIRNPETNESVIEELRALIRRIISRRLKPRQVPRYPVEEGDELIEPTEAVTEVKGGNLEPKVWETQEIKERRGQKFGEVEVTIICDRSSSMAQGGGAKMREQQKSAVEVMEALKDLSDLAEQERVNLTKPLDVRSEIYSFQADARDAIPLKAMSPELSEKQRVEVSAVLSSAPGNNTTDWVPLEKILAGLLDEIKQKISAGELKKIVIVYTDGISGDVQRVKNALEKLRSAGVIVIGIGITEAGRPALDTYAPDARLAETAEKLPIVLADLLQEHLADI